MTANKRIFLNVVTTYGRSLYALVIGLFCGRWTLMSLGETDYGLFGLVGGLAAFVVYLSNLFSSSIGRYFALSVGLQHKDPQKGIEQGRMWFTTAVMIHTIFPTIIALIGYPIGSWTISSFLVMPPDRVDACIWVWRCVCVSCYLGLVSTPLNAMYGAHQYIAEVTVYSFVTTSLNALFLYYMVTHPGVWLVKFAIWQCLLNITPNVVIAIRAYFLFPECRFVPKYMFNIGNFKKLCGFALWTSIGSLGAVLRAQGIAVLVNKYFGPRVNAGVAVGSSLSGQCNMLSGSLIGAFSPAIYNAWGECNYESARKLAFRVCKYGTLLILIFALPLALEVDEVLRLWLKHPPRYASELCLFVMSMNVIDKMAVGHMICVNANGNIARYQSFLGTSLLMTLPLAWILVALGFGVYSIGWAMVATMLFCAGGRVIFARRLVFMSARYWALHVFAPLMLVIVAGLLVGLIPRLWMGPSFLRVCLTTALIEAVVAALAWAFVMDSEERDFIVNRLKSFV